MLTPAANDQAQNHYKAKIQAKIQANCFIFFLNIYTDSYEQAETQAKKQIETLKRKKRIDKVQLLGLERI